MKQFRVLMCVVGALHAANAGADSFAVETYVGSRPAEAERVMARLRPILLREGFVADPAMLSTMFAEHRTQPGLLDPRFDGDKWTKRIEDGVSAYVDADTDAAFDLAATILGPQLAVARRNRLVLAREPKYREEMRRALIYYALARGRQSTAAEKRANAAGKDADRDRFSEHAAAAATDRDAAMADLIRTYPRQVILTKDFGGEAELLFQRSRREADSLGRARLEVSSIDPDAVVYFNEMVQGRSKATIGDLVPGRSRVLVEAPSGEALEYSVELIANQTSRITADLEFDSMLHLGPWVGFTYRSAKDRAGEAELVVKLARSTSGSVAATISVARRNGRSVVSGTVYGALNGKLGRSAEVVLTGRDDDGMLFHLSRYLATGVGVEYVTVLEHPEYTAPPAAPLQEIPVTPPPTLVKEAAASSAPLPPAREPTRSATTSDDGLPRYLLPTLVIAGGLGAVAAGTYISWTVTPSEAGPQQKYLYSKPGIALAVGGGVVTIFGGYLWYRAWRSAGPPKTAPTMALSSNGATIGWAAAF